MSYAQPSAPPPKYEMGGGNISKGEKVEKLLEKYEIHPFFSEKLSILDDFEIVCIIDDSGSMKTPLNDHTGHATRWDELKNIINTVMDIALTFDDDGVDLHFLNRGTFMNVTNHDILNEHLKPIPYGRTPLTRVANQVFDQYAHNPKKVLVLIATDRVPTNQQGYPDLKAFEECIRKRDTNKFYVSFLACSDNDDEIGYLNTMDSVPHVDILDDYYSEKKQILKIQGNKFPYSLQDHIVRLILGPIYSEFDDLDEKPIHKSIVSHERKHDGTGGCTCIII